MRQQLSSSLSAPPLLPLFTLHPLYLPQWKQPVSGCFGPSQSRPAQCFLHNMFLKSNATCLLSVLDPQWLSGALGNNCNYRHDEVPYHVPTHRPTHRLQTSNTLSLYDSLRHNGFLNIQNLSHLHFQPPRESRTHGFQLAFSAVCPTP